MADKTTSSPPLRRSDVDRVATPTRPVRLRRIRHAVRSVGHVLAAARPRQSIATAAALALVAAVDGRAPREVAVVMLTVLVGQAILGWLNDLVDRERDQRHDNARKAVAHGHLPSETLWYVLCCGVLVLIPLAITSGLVAGGWYLCSMLVAAAGTLALRHGLLSWLPWAITFALYPGFLSYGGWGGAAVGDPPQPAMVGLFALLGIGMHVLTSIWGLVDDDRDGWNHLPLRLGRRLGATRLLTVTVLYLVLVVAGIVATGSVLGLSL